MAVVVRLQGLPVVAGSSDIRRFFSGLNIPDGGVHILGGERGDAFIIFETDEDARQAMSYSGGYIKGSRIQFFLSSKIELQSIIKNISKRVDRSGRKTGATRWTGFSNSGVGSHSNLGAPVNKRIGISNYDSTDRLEDSFHSNGSQSSNTDLSKSSYQPREESLMSDNLYLYICGMPYSATEDDVITFFAGLQVDEVIMFKTNGLNNGAGLVKFATPSDAMKGLQRDREYMGKRFIEIRRSNKGEWNKNSGRVGGQIDHPCSNEQFAHDFNKDSFFPSREYIRGDPDYSSLKRHTHSRSPPRIMTEDRFNSNGSQSSNADLSKSSCQCKEESLMSDNLYLYIRGMPYSATEDDVITFFAGLKVDGVIMFKTNGINNGAGLVKFATLSDAMKGLQRDREYMGKRFIEIRRSIEGTWIKYNGSIGKKDRPFSNEQFAHDLIKESSISSKERTRRNPDYSYSRRHTHSRSPPRIMTHTQSRSPPRRTEAHASSRSPLRRVMVRTRSRSPPSRVMKHRHSRSPSQRIVAHMSSRCSPRRVMAHTHSRSPPRRVTARSRSPFSGSTRSNSPHNKEYYIHIENLPPDIEKKDLKAFFGGSDIPSRHITFLKSYNDKASQEATVMFRSTQDYCSALGYHKHDLHGQQILLHTISKTEALQLARFSESKSSSERHHHVKEKSDWDGHSCPYTCVYARNFQYDVTKAEVQKFFAGFDICDNDIYLLYDDKGIGLGEALVKFRSVDEARKAESLNHQRFLGTEVLLRCISEKQMQEFGINVSSVSEEKVQNHLHTYERDQNVIPVDSQGLSIQGKPNHPSNSRHPSNDFISSHDQFRGSAPFTEYQSVHGHLTDGRCIPDSNVSSGSDCITLIKLQNIPFRASRNEILDFFHGYMIIPESLSLQHNEYGMFSGEAVIALANYNEAMAVINELNYRPIGEHKIRLSLV